MIVLSYEQQDQTALAKVPAPSTAAQAAVSVAQSAPGNWSDYNAALVARGSLTLWVDEQALSSWLSPVPTGVPGRPFTYSDLAVECMALLSCVYRLPLRSTQGLLHSIIELMGLSLPVPHYSTLCRRRQKLQVKLPTLPKAASLHLVVDSTGLKLFGEGEWKVRMHGWSRHRTWLRLHVGVDEATGEIRAAQLTPRRQIDKEVLPHLLEQVCGPIAQVSGDGGYDYMSCYHAIERVGARATIAPRSNARLWNNGQMQQRADAAAGRCSSGQIQQRADAAAGCQPQAYPGAARQAS